MPNFYNPYDEAFRANPWPIYHRMRDEAPAYFVEELNTWALSRFEDVLYGGMDRLHYTASVGTTMDALFYGAPTPPMFMWMDPPKHTHHRAVVNPLYQKDAVALLAEKIRSLTKRLLAPALQTGELEIHTLATQVGLYTIADYIGLQHTQIAHIGALIERFFHREPGVIGPTPEGFAAFGALREYILELLKALRVTPPPPDTHLHAWLTSEIDGHRMTDDEIFFSVFAMTVTGADTLALTCAGTVYYLNEHPDQYAEVRADHGLIPHAFAETGRFDQPTNVLGRRVVNDFELHGEKIRTGQNVLFLFASANRDDREFVDADQYQISRRPRRTMTFGAGIHACLGQHLARIEGKIILEEVFAAIPEYEVQKTRCKRAFSEFLQGYAHVPISFKPR